ncbi:hypothetical protein ASG05_14470 [Frigoribacterium sp. Leaf186]|nr:hypothetical protein ASG05_14470 [Frigoribacterium sp. Leaf186]
MMDLDIAPPARTILGLEIYVADLTVELPAFGKDAVNLCCSQSSVAFSATDEDCHESTFLGLEVVQVVGVEGL